MNNPTSGSVGVRERARRGGFFPRRIRDLRRPLGQFRGAAMLAGALALVAPLAAFAQTNAVPARITAQINESNLTTLRGNTHPLARPQFDRGAVADSQPMRRMLLLLQRSPQQETALKTLIDQQQSKSSPSYRQWLTPQQFGQQYGPAPADIQAVTTWLQSHGFQIARVATGGTLIEFSGTAGQVRGAFHTEIHRYVVNGEQHFANNSDPQIPAALTSVVAGPVTLHNFPRKAQTRVKGVFQKDKNTGKVTPIPSPAFTFNSAANCSSSSPFNSNCYVLGPGDFAAIYNVNPLWTTGINSHVIDGTGQTIAIVGDSEICTVNAPGWQTSYFGPNGTLVTCSSDDVAQFRAQFGLPTNPINSPNVILDGPDPGFNSDEIEGDLDVEWSGAVAKNATIDFVIAEGTEASAGTDLAAEYIVDNNLAPVMSESFSDCEFFLGANGSLFEYELWEQAAAQGITVIVSAGDSGSAGCDDNSKSTAVNGQNVNGIASTPFNVAAGGTDFDFTVTGYPANYWAGPNNNSTVNGIADVSALGYIPETPWNDSCAEAGVSGCNSLPANSPLLNIVGGGGGQSNCVDEMNDPITGFPTCEFAFYTNQSIPGWTKPAYQLTATGSGLTVGTDLTRDLPDVSLFAADGTVSNSFYIVCESDMTAGPCSVGQNFNFVGVGGTSSSAPAFAGIMALVNQNMVVNHSMPVGEGQGNANYVLYPLFAAQQGNANLLCNSSTGPNITNTTGCTFYDVTKGNNSVPCAAGTFNCSNTGTVGLGIVETCTPSNAPCSPVNTPSYTAGTGYDLATGLGSVNAFNLVSNWPGEVGAFTPTTTTLCLSATPSGCASSSSPSSVSSPITHGTPVYVSIGVTSGKGAPPASALNQPEDVALIGAFSGGTTQGVDRFDANTGNFDVYPLGGGGTVSSSTTELVGGTYTVSARYGGDGVFGSSTSTPGVNITVNPENSTASACVMVINNVTGQTVGQVLTSPYACSSANMAQYGDINLIRVDVVGTSGLETATGSVTLTDTGKPIVGPTGSTVSSFNLNSEGYLEDQTTFLAVGSHSFVAQYAGTSGSGDASYKASPNSTALSFTVRQCNTTTAITTLPTTIHAGAQVTITAFVDSSTTGNLSGGSLGANMGGTVIFTTPTHSATFPVGPSRHAPNWLAVGVCASLAVLVLLLLSFPVHRRWGVALATILLSAVLGTSVSCGGSSGGGGGGGGGSTTLGTVAPTATTDGNGFVAGQASITITPAATETITATYTGDTNYNGSTSTTVTITVQ